MLFSIEARSDSYSTQFKLLSVLLFAIACVLLYFGTGMLLVVPGYPGESYFVTKRILYSVLPTAFGGALLIAVGWLWGRARGTENYWKYVKRSFLCATAAISLFWIGLLIVAGFRQG